MATDRTEETGARKHKRSDDGRFRLPRWLELTRTALRVVVLAGKVAAIVCHLTRGH